MARFRWTFPLLNVCGVVVLFVVGKLLIRDPARHARVHREEQLLLVQFTWRMRPWDWIGGWA